jgi:hypothetical protein
METINEHGLHGAVRRRLTEADAPSDKNAYIKDEFAGQFDYDLGIKRKPYVDTENRGGPLVYQSDTSISEATTILSDLFKVLGGSDTSDAQAVINVLKKINKNNYYAILWKVRYGSSFKANNRFKSNFNSLTDYISKIGIDVPTSQGTGATMGPVGLIRNIFIDDTLYNWINSSMLVKYNAEEYISTAP